MSTRTTIILEKETRQLLQDIGRKSQTYDMLIRELIAIREKCEKEMSGSGLGFPTSVPTTRQQEVSEPKELKT